MPSFISDIHNRTKVLAICEAKEVDLIFLWLAHALERLIDENDSELF